MKSILTWPENLSQQRHTPHCQQHDCSVSSPRCAWPEQKAYRVVIYTKGWYTSAELTFHQQEMADSRQGFQPKELFNRTSRHDCILENHPRLHSRGSEEEIAQQLANGKKNP